MSKQENNEYANIPTAEPYVEGNTPGSSRRAVTLILDEKDSTNNNFWRDDARQILHGSRKPLELSFCPQCSKEHVRTKTRTYPNAGTWLGVAVGACIFFPLCWIPLVVDSMKQTDHFCQSCGKKIGTVKPLEGCCVKEQK